MRARRFASLAAGSLVAFASLVGCGKSTTIDDVSCPPGGTTLTYDDFGKAFIDANCQRCHGAPNADRNGAPSSFDFGTLDAIRAHKDRIFARAADDNTTMPPGPDDPPEQDRMKLGEWLACGAP